MIMCILRSLQVSLRHLIPLERLGLFAQNYGTHKYVDLLIILMDGRPNHNSHRIRSTWEGGMGALLVPINSQQGRTYPEALLRA